MNPILRNLSHAKGEEGVRTSDGIVIWDGRLLDGQPAAPGIYLYRMDAHERSGQLRSHPAASKGPNGGASSQQTAYICNQLHRKAAMRPGVAHDH